MLHEEMDGMFDRAARRFNSSVKELDEDVTHLEEWLKTRPHFPPVLGKHELRNFVILNKGRLEVTKRRITNYFELRSKQPELFYGMNPKFRYNKLVSEIMYFVPHPQITQEMYRIYFLKVKGETVSEKFDPLDWVRRFAVLNELRLRQEVLCGDIFVFDFKGATFSAALKFTPMLIYKCLVLLYEGVCGTPLKAAHIINSAPPVMKVINAIKPFFKPKIAERIHVYPEVDDLKKFISLNLLPVDFGGEGPSLQELEDELEQTFAKNQELFDRLDEIQVDERLRPENLKAEEIYGSFKKLDID